MTFRRQRKQNSMLQLFEREFALEILKSDRLRVTILLCVLGSAIVVVPVLSVFSFEHFQRAFEGHFKGFLFTFLLVMAVTLSCLAFERMAISRLGGDIW